MKGNYIYLLLILNFIFQSTLFQYLRILGVMPNTALILIVVISILYGREKGIISGVIAGFLQDVFFSRAIGINLLIYIIIAHFIGGFKNKLFKDNYLTPSILIFFSTIFYHLSFFVIMYFLKQPSNILTIFKNIIVLESALNIFIGIIVYKILFESLYNRKLR